MNTMRVTLNLALSPEKRDNPLMMMFGSWLQPPPHAVRSSYDKVRF
jgi:hypothetical protein